jgi:beta-glucanase (GH16 family)
VASTSQNNANCSGCTPDKVVDALTSTRWASDAWDDSQWIYVDLGATATVTRVVLRWEAAFGRGYQIQVSSNASTWTTIYTTTTGDGGIDDITGLNASGRYVRMNGTARGTAWGWSLWEFEIYGTGGAPNPTPTVAPTATPHGSNWTLVWSDEFNGTSLDMSNWTNEVNGSGMGNNELEYYTNGQNLSFENGALVITARRENPANYQCWYGTCTYTSGRLNTQGKRQFTYGRIESRIRVPYGQGIWPAFWMLGNNIGSVGWPTCGEIDIMENIGREPNIVHGTVHGPGYSGGAAIGGPYTLSSGNFTDAYHVFAVEWEPNVFRWYVDGNLYFTLNRSTVESRGQWVFDHPHFIILNLAVGGAWPGSPDGTTVFPQRMYIDYVRVYQ